MITKNIRTGKTSKIIACYLALQLILQILQPTALWALTGGPKQPEFNSFTPIGTSDMVNLSSGNFNYNIPIMDVGGYPLNLSYESGITMDQEASWVGLGWNLNVGQINRNVRGLPDDFKGDEMVTENHQRDNVTVTTGANLDVQLFGVEKSDVVKIPKKTFKLNGGVKLTYNNYTGISFKPSFGLAYSISENLQVGTNLEGSSRGGATISPNVNLKSEMFNKLANGSLDAGVSYNSLQGLSSFNLALSITPKERLIIKKEEFDYGIGSGGSISFANPTYTPRKRTAYRDIAGSFSASFGVDIWGGDGEVESSASASVQKVKNPIKTDKAYGYEFSGYANKEDLLDYNRENDQLISKTTQALPVTNYTYDTYSVQAQGIGGQFRPYRSKVSHINDEFVQDASESFSLGVEIEPGSGFHAGVNFTKVESNSHTGIWNTPGNRHFKQEDENNKKGHYEPVYFKYVGENHVDRDEQLFNNLGGYNPIALKISGKGFGKFADSQFKEKQYTSSTTTNKTSQIPSYVDTDRFNKPFKRASRVLKNQNILKISRSELFNYYKGGTYFKDWQNRNKSSYIKDHHTAELRILNADGASYIFGEPVYNKTKHETVFTTKSTGDCSTGIVNYQPGENTMSNKSGKDHYYNKIKTPAYAHTYLLSSILSKDYEDLTNNGPTDDDLGSFTKFEYKKGDASDYKWRVPYGKNEASYNAGLNTDKSDQKASYVYGEKEIKYIHKITTKTHIAIFSLDKRKDGKGVVDDNGGYKKNFETGGSMYKLNTIKLYSKPEYEKLKENALPIKTAHFDYSYKLCPNIHNHQDYNPVTNSGPGKLTLERVYFTYRGSNMGKYTPYIFDYGTENPSYNLKGYDIWGNFKPNVGGCNTQDPITAAEFPFVQQDDKELQDRYASAWSLKRIGLPSGGTIDLEYETDDYQYVQNKKAMQMIKVIGVGNTEQPSESELNNTQLYKHSASGDNRYLYIKLPLEVTNIEDFKKKYLYKIIDNPIYFRFLMNMTKHGNSPNSNSRDYDYVTGYFELDKQKDVAVFNDGKYAAIPMKFVDLEGGLSGNNKINPITKAGLYFARRYLNAQSLGLEPDASKQKVGDIVREVVTSFNSFRGLFTGPNQELRKNQYAVAKRFIPEKSWIRLTTPKSNKLGGGVRVKRLLMSDNWKNMLGKTSDRYDNVYGQEYNYTLENGTTSGVATFEPNQSKENPFVEPFYNDGDRLVAPKEVSYIEKPFGASFFPSSTVTYSRVTVSNLAKDGVTNHATGKVVTCHYTTKDFPTRVDHTDIDSPSNYTSNQNAVLANAIKSAFGARVNTNNEITLSQGFVIHTNDMNGKMKSQTVYPEGSDIPISSVAYKYNTKKDSENELSSKVTVVSKNGKIEQNQSIGVDYDVVLDFRESFSEVSTRGLKTDLAVLPTVPFIIIIPSSFPENINVTNTAHSVITTKVIHTTAIMKEKIAKDLGAQVTTTNEAWDKNTGQILLTKTVNEYDDHYYNFNFPAYWKNENMGMASTNIGIEGVLTKKPGNSGYFQNNGTSYFALGDEILAKYNNKTERLWVVARQAGDVLLMNRDGQVINKAATKQQEAGGNVVNIESPISYKIVRSGYRNLQASNMGSITTQRNPLLEPGTSNTLAQKITPNTFNTDIKSTNNLKVINASAVAYTDFWNCQCEQGLPSLPVDIKTKKIEDIPIYQYGFNPYLFNAKGEWRADKSYAYLSERVKIGAGATTVTKDDKLDTRNEGFFKEFSPYYAIDNQGNWLTTAVNNKWTFASQVNQYSPYGAELENKDALNRFSSAQYGYNYTLPTAVASNSKYRTMGADNMEDYSFFKGLPKRFNYLDEGELEGEEHFNFKKAANDDGFDGVRASNRAAHTGLLSLEVPQGDEARFKRPLKGQLERKIPNSDGDKFNDLEDKCPYTASLNNNDYDGDGIGDICDDDVVPRITNLIITPQTTYRIKQAYFKIQGKPNDVVKYQLNMDRKLNRGQSVWINRGEKLKGDFYQDSITLDVTGKADMHIIVKGSQPRRKHSGSRAVLRFSLLNKNSNTIVYIEGEEQTVRICPQVGRNKSSYNNDRGSREFNCDKYSL